jgi:hypothetical protein
MELKLLVVRILPLVLYVVFWGALGSCVKFVNGHYGSRRKFKAGGYGKAFQWLYGSLAGFFAEKVGQRGPNFGFLGQKA